MKRRAFITLLGSAATWPIAAHAQQQGVRTEDDVRELIQKLEGSDKRH